MRTREQIIADCEKRFEELQREAEAPARQRPCKTCRFYSTRGDDGYRWGEGYPEYHTCTEPLVQGFGEWGVEVRKKPMPCGPEKALWQPIPHKPTLCERILAFLTGDPA